MLVTEARIKALRREQNERAWLAWHVAALQRAKKLPRLQTMMHSERRRRPQTPQEMLAIVQMLNARAGGKVVKRQVH